MPRGLIQPHKGDKRYVRRKGGKFTSRQADVGRRSFIKFAVTGLAAATLAPGAHADTPMVSDADPTAKALHYVEDAANSSVRTDKSADCANCMQYKGMAGAADGPCVIFQGKSVKAKGWCSAWVKKP
jgi:hypothetical protein